MSVFDPIIMVATQLLTRLFWALGYPSFAPLKGQYQVGAIQTRLPDCVACQIHYPAEEQGSNDKTPYWRPKAVVGLADYSRTSATLLSFLSLKKHPCHMNAEPIRNKKFPLVVFSHGLGGSMEMYTQLCQQIASHGYLVVAMEHEDGSGAYAETPLGKPIRYKRPDETPYSREKVLNFRRAFLQQRVQETTQLLDVIMNKPDSTTIRVQKILKLCDTSEGVSLVGHSFGAATMILAAQKYLEEKCFVPKSLSIMDVWAFSLEDKVLDQGVPLPTVHVLSEDWITNPETAQVDQFLQNCPKLSSFYAPNSVHASFSDAVSWLPRVIGSKLYLRGKKEQTHVTIPATAQACIQNIQSGLAKPDTSITNGLLKAYDYGKSKREMVTTSES
jgi:platelet-activating factor acetylhydrolase